MHLIVGPGHHGVVRFGVELDDALLGDRCTVQRRLPGAEDLPGADFAPGQGIHLQFTDRLFGRDARAAAATVDALLARVRGGGGRCSATLHDIPQPSDGNNHQVRAEAYARLCRSLDAVVVASEHERKLLSDIGVDRSVTVIPLPIAPSAPPHTPGPGPSTVAVFGFVYPGKGHAEVLKAVTELPPDVGMVAIGAASVGHDDLVDELHRTAQAANRRFVVTGHIPEEALASRLRGVTVPVVHHRHVSASGSLNSWMSAGRRPLAAATRYVREIAARNPHAVSLYPDDEQGLSAAIRAALAEPASTWLAPGTVCSPSPDEVARCYRRLIRSVHR